MRDARREGNLYFHGRGANDRMTDANAKRGNPGEDK